VSHVPVDHPLRGLYRALAGLVGLLQIVFGVVAYLETSSLPFFTSDGVRVFGLTANRGFAVVSLVTGLIVLVGVVLGRNRDVSVNLGVGSLMLINGMGQMLVLTSGVNYLAFSMTNCNVSFVLGLVLLAAGLYGKVSVRTRAVHRSRPRVEAESVGV
jgi:hypothetical protein